ncbi:MULTISPECIES: hypothetical protein [unclassified Bradyrhizobium]|uniref:hypothetical protein n=1 Tax=unclassified Bradyrhizobium TaxID=2631580 RepID=UPI001FF99BAC|nr:MULTISPECIES: hypothetical protein [unclassified Bradyrhizobium]MCK1714211.1 hypothetical protein [Bradyrhizobium sp. 143]MCK1725613.1 hypothetical protein [Bradyrhizobium sp. 142]
MINRSKSPPSSNAESSEQQYEKLLAAMGLSEAGPYRLYPLKSDLERIKRDYAHWVAAPDRKLVRSYRAAITNVIALSGTIGPAFFGNEIEKAGLSRLNPDLDDDRLRELMEEHRHEQDDLVAALTGRGLDIDHWLKTSHDAYKKRDLRKLVMEPFLRLMAEQEIITSRKHRPRKRIFDALFDWLGVDKKSRPTSANIDTIARELGGSASTLKPNAKRRTKK